MNLHFLVRLHCIVCAAFLSLAVFDGLQALAEEEPVNFNRDIQPLLSDTCYPCHGPDKANREAELRLDTEAGAFSDRGDYRIIQPGSPEKSELYRRLTSSDPDERMPPPDAEVKLSAEQVELFRRWIQKGSPWSNHWAFAAPIRAKLPNVKNANWSKNAIDRFLLSRLQREGIKPAAEASKETLIRRVTFDLNGLPPTPAEVDAFLADQSAHAYEKVVDRLLKSTRYGERMASDWLDVARYADTSGYQNDGPRSMWRWRDWVIEAFNSNMPFDQFTIEQIAGDMLPKATLNQRIATGFNRNHRGNAEGGIIPEEYAVEYVVDRVETTAAVFLGLTLGCARCHEHKYDPFLQKEFYQIFAYFNNIPENGRAIKEGNSPPLIKAPTEQQQQSLAALQNKLAAAQATFEKLSPQLISAQAAWEKAEIPAPAKEWTILDGLVARYELDGAIENIAPRPSAAAKEKVAKPAGAASEKEKKEIPQTPSFVGGEPTYVSRHGGKAIRLSGENFVQAGDAANFGYFDKFTLSAWINARGDHGGTILSRMVDVDRGSGYYLTLRKGKLHFNLVKRWLDDSIRVESKADVPSDRWVHVTAVYDGSRTASGIQLYVDGKLQELKVNLDGINQSFASVAPLRIGGGGGPESRFIGGIDDARVYRRNLSADEAALISTEQSPAEIVKIPSQKRTSRQTEKLRAYYLRERAPQSIRDARHRLIGLQQERRRLVESFPTVMVMQEMSKPRDTYLLLRGAYDKPAGKVSPGVPASLHDLPKAASNNRLGFAYWLVDRNNPLTARVTVNRFWQNYFGVGLVKTTEDFGTQGELPSNPELLDYLAVDFMESGWNVKALQKKMVMSAAYRQSSSANPQLLEKDPENRLLARGPRFRLSAEMIRDQALFASGLLVEKIGGPSVKPYQPAGLWKEIASVGDYNQDKGEGLYRRSLYTYWKRTVASPTMMVFDASARETCLVRRSRTNTPLQALTLMNDVTFVEAARVLAQKVMLPAGLSPSERIELAFRRLTSRSPKAAEMEILLAGYEHHLAEYRRDQKAALQLVSAGEFSRDQKLNIAELAAYTTLASLIMNLDETVTKE